MLEVIYRIYQVADKEKEPENGYLFWDNPNIELTMDCKICDSRDHFKELIKEEYGDKIAFRNTKKLKTGDLYCIIIGEHCWNTERYFNKVTFCCDCCGAKIETFYYKPICLSDYEIRHYLFGIEEYKQKRFCSNRCRDDYTDKERKRIKPDEEKEFFIEKDMFTKDVSGYIYKISKKSTNEFYVGQTIYAPVFRWGQHLKTDRFPIENIEDYKFEVLEIVPKTENILEREKYYIQKYYKENPEKSLNIMCTANIDANQMELQSEVV